MSRIARLIGSSLIAWAIAFGASTAEAQLFGGVNKLDALLQPRAQSSTGRSRVIVRAINSASSFWLRTIVQQMGGVPGRSLPILDALAADVPNSALAAFNRNPLVLRVALDRVVRGTLERTSAAVGATSVRQELGYDGSGVGIAVIDSGVTPAHDDLTAAGAPGVQRVDAFVDFVNGGSAPYDDYGHGTHVAGIIAGNGFDSGGARSGIAPGARLVVLKVLDGAGRGRISDVIAALDYVVANRNVFHTRIVNVSLGAGVFESYDADFLTLAAKRAVDAGLVVVASAGNAGSNSQGHAAYGGITAPGNAPWVLTVGASSTQGTIDRADDIVASFSSRGPTAVDRLAKPDLLAPGVGTESLSAPESFLFATRSAYLLNGTVPTSYPPYLTLSGTSQAAPVVAGTIALMLQANPALTPNAIKAILQYTAQTYAGYDALTEGTGFLDARGAVDIARFFASPALLPYPSSPNWSRQLIWSNHRIRGGLLWPGANAWGIGVRWGAAQAPDGNAISWGIQCSSADCSTGSSQPWTVICLTQDCAVPIWGDVTSENVVWSWTCGGFDCVVGGIVLVWSPADMLLGNAASTSADDGDTVVWGTTGDEGDTVVWGTADDGDTVVWGTADDGDTVVWGTSADEDTVVWGTTYQDGVDCDGSCEDSDLTALE